MFTLASLRSDEWTAWPEQVDDMAGIRREGPVVAVRPGFVVLKNLALPRFRKINFEVGQVLH